MIAIKRIYDPADPLDGYRILVDRVWPRGITRARANIDVWLKDVAPSPALRKWFAHDPAKWKKFQQRYVAELHAHDEPLRQLRMLCKRHHNVTLLFGASDVAHNQAVVLRDQLRSTKRERKAE